MGTPPGWYPDPQAPDAQRWWDGVAWTNHTAAPQAPAPWAAPQGGSGSPVPVPVRQDSRTWALAAHLSALVGLVIGFSFLGPLVVYLVKKDDDPYVRAHAAEALNFNLSVFIYALVGGFILVILVILLIGILLIPVAIAAAIGWIVLVIVAAIKAGRGELYRYPLTIRFVS
jgi:uncharacterized Tic20 family protein